MLQQSTTVGSGGKKFLTSSNTKIQNANIPVVKSNNNNKTVMLAVKNTQGQVYSLYKPIAPKRPPVILKPAIKIIKGPNKTITVCATKPLEQSVSRKRSEPSTVNAKKTSASTMKTIKKTFRLVRPLNSYPGLMTTQTNTLFSNISEHQIVPVSSLVTVGKTPITNTSSSTASNIKDTISEISPQPMPEPKTEKEKTPTVKWRSLMKEKTKKCVEPAPKRIKMANTRTYSKPRTAPSVSVAAETGASNASINMPDLEERFKQKFKIDPWQRYLIDWRISTREDLNFNTPLHHAIMNNNEPRVRQQAIILKNQFYHLNHQDKSGKTGLMIAACMTDPDFNPKIVTTLITYGADICIKDNKGNSALHLGAKYASPATFRALMDAPNVDKIVNDLNDDGLAAIHICALKNHHEIINILADEANLNIKDAKSGRTGLFHALESKSVDAARTLIGLGASTMEPSYSGQLPINVYGNIAITCAEPVRKNQ